MLGVNAILCSVLHALGGVGRQLQGRDEQSCGRLQWACPDRIGSVAQDCWLSWEVASDRLAAQCLEETSSK